MKYDIIFTNGRVTYITLTQRNSIKDIAKAAYTRCNRLYDRLYNRLHRVYGV